MNLCASCGADVGDDAPRGTLHCGECPPTPCATCGEMCDWSKGRLCPCWTPFDGDGLADVKALFADDCDGLGLSVEVSIADEHSALMAEIANDCANDEHVFRPNERGVLVCRYCDKPCDL